MLSFSADRLRSGGGIASVSVLELNGTHLLDLDVPLRVAGPSDLGAPTRERELRLFNPSIVVSPRGLCRRCAFVATLRADALHQCDASNAFQTREPGMPARVATNAWFKGTIVAVLDAQLHVLAWTWLLCEPAKQVMVGARRSADDPSRSGWHVPSGVSGGFSPPWTSHAYDARLFNLDGEHLLVTFLRSCHAHQPCPFGVSQLQLTSQLTADGGLGELRAWAHPTFAAKQPWAQGRNQALFTAEHALYVQPWPGVIASFGRPKFAQRSVRCEPWASASPAQPKRSYYAPWERRENRAACATTPAGTDLTFDLLCAGGAEAADDEPFGELRLRYNHSARLLHSMGSPPAAAPLATAAQPLRSLSTNMVHVAFGTPTAPCWALLGVGHVHRSEGLLNRRQQQRQRRQPPPSSAALPSADPFVFGADYDHHFFTLSPRPPFTPLATSSDFCLAAAQDGRDCERVQFVSGLTLLGGDDGTPSGTAGPEPELLLAYGVNDCEARVGRLALSRLRSMLRPLPGAAEVCETRGRRR